MNCNCNWENLVRVCEHLMGCPDHAESANQSNLPNLIRGVKSDLPRFMSYAYHRGRLDASGMPDGTEKEILVKRLGQADAQKWESSAQALLSMCG